MSGRSKSKTKKPLETTLGKAPKEGEKVDDVSVLRKPINTSVYGLKHVLTLLKTATSEVQDYISFECEILYECRICRNIFRSLANFILHKRNFCKEKCMVRGDSLDKGGFVISHPAPKPQGEDIKSSSRSPTPEKKTEDLLTQQEKEKSILPIIDKLLQRQKVRIMAKETLNEDLSNKDKNEDDDDVIFVSEESNVVLEKIDSNGAAMFQTKVKDESPQETNFTKSEVLEMYNILENNDATLDSSGKISNFTSVFPKKPLTCTECNFTFSTFKTLTHHIKYKHNKTCIVYPCPDCKETFSNAWSVYRHLYKVHRKTTAQVRKMRDLVHSSGIRKDQEPEKKKRKIEEVSENEENQWMNNFEGDKDLQMCGGCGKRFERKAALHSHSQMCTKRLAVCNSLKNVKVQRKEEEKSGDESLKGAARRKPTTIHKHVSKTEEMTITKESEESLKKNEEKKPEIEIFTISDDSNDSISEEDKNNLKQKRTIWDFQTTKVEISDDYLHYLNDETDRCFVAKALTYINKNELKCIPCQSTFLSIYRLLRHMSAHFSWFRFQCSKCPFMSFNQYDCTAHAHSHHGVPQNLMASTVLPIPKWKVLCTSHDFERLADANQGMPRLEAIEEKGEEKSETIVLEEDDEMPDICTGSGGNLVILDEDEKKAGPSNLGVSNRPIRNRTKSVKTVQNDFIYDLGKVLKYDSSSRNRKVGKKCLGKS